MGNHIIVLSVVRTFGADGDVNWRSIGLVGGMLSGELVALQAPLAKISLAMRWGRHRGNVNSFSH